ncbi:MAG: hypothetical protein CMP20_09170 [Rickettsiales bacterium]|nr:hypothetical protein [Rickettsiales bacterium]
MIIRSGKASLELSDEQVAECNTFAQMIDDIGPIDQVLVPCSPETLALLGDWFHERLDWKGLSQHELLRLVAFANYLYAETLLDACRQEFSRRVNSKEFRVDGFMPWSSLDEAQQQIDALPDWLDKQALYRSLGA